MDKLVQAATESVGRKHGANQAVDQMMLELLKEIPASEYIMAIKGLGRDLIAFTLSEIGDIQRFSDPPQIIKILYALMTKGVQYDPQQVLQSKGVAA